MDAAFRGLRASRAYASRTWPAPSPPGGDCAPGMLVLADRNFCGYPFAAVLAAYRR